MSLKYSESNCFVLVVVNIESEVCVIKKCFSQCSNQSESKVKYVI